MYSLKQATAQNWEYLPYTVFLAYDIILLLWLPYIEECDTCVEELQVGISGLESNLIP